MATCRAQTSRGVWEFLSVICPHADITSSNVAYFSSFTLLESAQKCAILKVKGIKALSVAPSSPNREELLVDP